MSLGSSMLNLDANATSRLRPQARAAVEGYLTEAEHCGNPSSVHQAGQAARALVRKAREDVLKLLFADGACGKAKLFFTSGGTEACNSIVCGFSLPGGSHIVSSAIEHQAVLEPLEVLRRRGHQVSLAAADAWGVLGAANVKEAVQEDTKLVCLMAANNVTGALQPVAEAAELLRESGYQGAIVSDATQALSKSHFSLSSLFAAGVDAAAFSGHKIGAPAGVGVVVLAEEALKREPSFSPLILGGPQEERLRAGTENLLGIIGFGAAAQALLQEGLRQSLSGQCALRESFWESLRGGLSDIQRLSPFGQGAESCLSNTLALRIPGVRADDFVVALDLAGVAASTGSACASGRQEVSHVFRHMSEQPQALLSEAQTSEAFRLSFDWDATRSQLEDAAKTIASAAAQMRDSR